MATCAGTGIRFLTVRQPGTTAQCRGAVQAIQVHNSLHAFSKPWASAAVQHSARLLPMLDILTLDLTEVALIVFG